MGMTHPGRQNDHMVTFPAREGAWRAMDSTLTAVLSVDGTQHVCVCAAKQAASPLIFVLQPPCTLTGCNTAGAGQHRLIRSAPSSPADVAIAHNYLPPSCATGPGPIAHPTSRSMTSPAPLVTVMIRPAADETTTRGGRPLAQAYVANGPASYAR